MKRSARPFALFLGAVVLATAALAAPPAPPVRDAAGFPLPDRPVSKIVSAAWSTEPDRDRAGEVPAVLAELGIRRGMTVADIGAGEGYYTLKLSASVGPRGQVLAEDIMPTAVDALRARVAQAKLANVTVTLGTADDAKLPSMSADRILLVHMYHEIASPYALLWRLRPVLKAGGRLAIVDADRRTNAHGTPPRLLACELAAAGYNQIAFKRLPQAGGYLAQFVPSGPPPAPAEIKPCPAR